MIIVVSPLIALMKDQVKLLCDRGITAIHVDSGSLDDSSAADVQEGKYQILYFSPEQLIGNVIWRDMIQSSTYENNLVGFIVDEAHCVKQW